MVVSWFIGDKPDSDSGWYLITIETKQELPDGTYHRFVKEAWFNRDSIPMSKNGWWLGRAGKSREVFLEYLHSKVVAWAHLPEAWRDDVEDVLQQEASSCSGVKEEVRTSALDLDESSAGENYNSLESPRGRTP